MEIKDSFPINFHSGNRGPQMRRMLFPKNESLTDDMQKGIITFQAQEIKINQKGEHEIITLTKPRLFKGDKLVFKTPSVKIYTNKNIDLMLEQRHLSQKIRRAGGKTPNARKRCIDDDKRLKNGTKTIYKKR